VAVAAAAFVDLVVVAAGDEMGVVCCCGVSFWKLPTVRFS
jgi:hypothetical protein